MACNGIQIQSLYIICINSVHALYCHLSNAMSCPSAILIAFEKLISGILCCYNQPIQLHLREGSSSPSTVRLERYNMALEMIVNFASDMMEYVDVEPDISLCYIVVNGYEPSSPSLISSTSFIEEPADNAVDYC